MHTARFLSFGRCRDHHATPEPTLGRLDRGRCCDRHLCRAIARPHRAHRVLARPRPDHSASARGRRARAEGALARARRSTAAPPGTTRVVCGSGSLARARTRHPHGPPRATGCGPPQPKRRISAKQARTLLALNRRLRQALPLPPDPAGGHRVAQQRPRRGHARRLHGADRRARSAPLPPQCEHLPAPTPSSGTGAVSYAYQYHCPNAQNLVAVIGRALGPGQDPPSSPTGRPDPHGIPNARPLHPLQPADRGLGRDARRRRHRRRPRRVRQRRRRAVGLEEGRRAQGRPRRRLRPAQLDRAPRGGARRLRPRDRRLPAQTGSSSSTRASTAR